MIQGGQSFHSKCVFFLSLFRFNLQLCMILRRSWCAAVEDKPPFFAAHPGGKQFGDYDERHLCPGMRMHCRSALEHETPWNIWNRVKLLVHLVHTRNEITSQHLSTIFVHTYPHYMHWIQHFDTFHPIGIHPTDQYKGFLSHGATPSYHRFS